MARKMLAVIEAQPQWPTPLAQPLPKSPVIPDEPPLLLTAPQAGALLGKSSRWIYRQVAASRLPARRFGRTVLFSRFELLQWAAGVIDGQDRHRSSGSASGAGE